MTQPIVLYAGFDKGTDPVTGLTVTVNVYRITRSSGASSQIVTAGSATALGDGVYLYAIGSADLQTYDYLAAFKTTGDWEEIQAALDDLREMIVIDHGQIARRLGKRRGYVRNRLRVG